MEENNNTNSGENNETPEKQKMRVVKQKTHYFSQADKHEEIDNEINAWMLDKFKKQENPMIQERLIVDNELYVYTLFTEVIELD